MGVIENGTGNGLKAKVDKQNRLHTQSLVVSEEGYVSQVSGTVFLPYYSWIWPFIFHN